MDLREFDLLYNKDSPLYDSTALSNLIYNTLLKEALIRPKAEREVEPKVEKVSTISSTTTHKRKLPYTKYQESFYVNAYKKRQAAFKKECDGSKPTNYDSKSSLQTNGKMSSVESIRERKNSFTPSQSDPESDKKFKEQNENWNISAPCTNFYNSKDNTPFENKGRNIEKNVLQSNTNTNKGGFSDRVTVRCKFNERKISPDKEPIKDKVLEKRTHEHKGEAIEIPTLNSTINSNVSDLRNKIKETPHKSEDCAFASVGLPPVFHTNNGDTKSNVYEFTDEKNDRHRQSSERNTKRDYTRFLRDNIRDSNTQRVVGDNTSINADSTMAIHTQSGQSAFSQSCSMSNRNALENRTTLNIQDHDNVAQHSGIKQEALGFDDMNYPFGYHNKTSMSSNHSKTPRTNATYSPDVNSNIRIHEDETATVNDSITTTSTSTSITSHSHPLHLSPAYETPHRVHNVNHLTHGSGTQLHFENPFESHPGSTYSMPQNAHTFETHFGNRIAKPQTAHNNDLYYGTTHSKTSTANNYSMDSSTGFVNPPYAHNYDLHNRHPVSISSTEYNSDISRGTAVYMLPPAAHNYDMFRVPLPSTPATTHRHNLHNKPVNVNPSDAYNYGLPHHPQFAHEHMLSMPFSHGNAASESAIQFERDFHHGTDVSKLKFAQKPLASKSTDYTIDQLVTKPSSSPHYHGPSQLISSAPIAHQSYMSKHEAIPPNPAEQIPELSITRTIVESHPRKTESNKRTDTHFEHSPLKVTGPDTNGANSNLESHPRNMDTISNIDNNGASSHCRNTNSQRGYTHKIREAHPTLDSTPMINTHTNTADSTETTSNTLKVPESGTSDSNTSTTKSTTDTNTNESTKGSIEGCKELSEDNSEVTQSSNSDHSTKIVSSPNRRTNELLSEEEIKAMIEAVVKANSIFEEFPRSKKDEKKLYTIQNEYLNQTQTSADGTKTQIKEQRKLLVLETTVKYLERKITESVRFAKRIPGFGELPIDDQVNLIKESRTESGIIGGMKGINVKNKVFSANKEIHFSFEDLRLLFSEALLYHKMMLSKRIAALAMNEAEEALLRAISITAPDRCPMLCYSKVDTIQQKLMYCLEYVTTGGGTKPGGARLGKMVDVLIECRYATEVDMKELKSVLEEWSLLSKYKLIEEYL